MCQAEPGLLGFWSSGEAVGGLGDQKRPGSEERPWLPISHKPHFLQPVSQEGEPPGFHPQVGLWLPNPGSLACGGLAALAGGGTAEFVTCICPPLCGPHNASRTRFPLLVTFPASVSFAL